MCYMIDHSEIHTLSIVKLLFCTQKGGPPNQEVRLQAKCELYERKKRLVDGIYRTAFILSMSHESTSLLLYRCTTFVLILFGRHVIHCWQSQTESHIPFRFQNQTWLFPSLQCCAESESCRSPHPARSQESHPVCCDFRPAQDTL